MDRRGFLRGLGAVVGGLAIEQAIPLGRVWSFPTEIKVVKATLGQYAGWVNFSDLLASGVAEELAYRLDVRMKSYYLHTE